MMQHIAILMTNDLAITIKNRSIFLILFIPVFVFFSLSLIDTEKISGEKVEIGLIKNHAYPPHIINSITIPSHLIAITWLANKEDGIAKLKEHRLDGLLTRNEISPDSLALMVFKKESLQTLAIVDTIAMLQKTAEKHPASWISRIEPLHKSGLQQQSLPTWILMLVLLVSFIILPAQVAEEKEKQLLLALLQTPMHEMEWLAAKLITGMVLIVLAVGLLHGLARSSVPNLFSYAAFIMLGSFCFSASGIFLGLLCRNQASARTLGVMVYLPLLLPSALADVSEKLTSIAPYLPSYQLYMPIQAILLEDRHIKGLLFESSYLLLSGILMFFLAYGLMKKRWLM